MNAPPKLRFHLQMPFLYPPAGHVPVHFENNRVQLLQWLLPLHSMRKQSVYDSDWNFSYHPEPEESGHVWIIYGNRFCVRNQLVVTLDKLT